MLRRPIESLGATVRERRGKKKLRETAKEIGIGPATLMRVESGRIPDLETFGRICKWLGMDPGTFLGIDSPKAAGQIGGEFFSFISAHFRSDETPKPETVNALAKMVLYTLKAQPRSSDLEE
jgi:transcriptional regulator with XRE-family HTH domain